MVGTSFSLKNEEISFVVQGPINNEVTRNCLLSIRRFFPKSTIILSTWEGSDVRALDYDLVVFSKDPGAVKLSQKEGSPTNNLNRQIISTITGLKKVRTTYCVKTRTDIEFIGNKFTDFFQKYIEYNCYKFFKERIIAPNFFFKNPRRGRELLFHISDIFHFGYTDDLIDLWDIPLAPEPEFTRWFDTRFKFFNTWLYPLRYTPEQYIWIHYLKKRDIDVDLDYHSHITYKNIILSEMTIVDNFVILTPEQLGFNIPERFYKYERETYTVSEWLDLYNKYCLSRINEVQQVILTIPVFMNKVKHFCRVIQRRKYRDNLSKMIFSKKKTW